MASSGVLRTAVLSALKDSSHRLVGILADGTRLWPLERYFWPLYWLCTDPGNCNYPRPPVVWLGKSTDGCAAELRRLNPDLVLVAGFRIILSREILRIPKIGCLNIHPSLLPRHRGPNPLSNVILSGEQESGASFHAMTDDIDSGPIIAQYRCIVEASDTADTLSVKANQLIRDNLLVVLALVETNGLYGIAQDESQATYDKRLTKDRRRIDWSDPAENILRLIRSQFRGKYAWFPHHGAEIHVERASFNPIASDAPPGTVLIAGERPTIQTGDGAITIHAAHRRLAGQRWLRMTWKGGSSAEQFMKSSAD